MRRNFAILSVHADAFRLSPKDYLQTRMWRIRGFRVRARNRLSLLAARSSRVYDLWVVRDEPSILRKALATASSSEVIIVPVIDCRDGAIGLNDTVRSVQEAGVVRDPIVIGGPSVPQTIRIEEPSELAGALGSDGTWLCAMNAGDLLAPNALAIYANAAAQAAHASVIYADDDLVDANGKRCAPHFKPDWNPELFEHHDYLTGSAIVRATSKSLADIPSDGWAEMLLGAGLEQCSAPIHLPFVLHHRRERPSPVVPGKPVTLVMDPAPLVTAIVPTRNKAELLRNCIGGLKRANYPRIETIIVDNGTDEPDALALLNELENEGMIILRMPGPYNYSLLNNFAVTRAKGEVLCFLNNDVEMIDHDWLALLVRQAIRPELGAVGARLLYPDGKIQHAGVFVGICDAAGHGHRFQGVHETGYFQRTHLPQQVSAVTGACMVVSREKFLSVGGFDERQFKVAFNDVDLCLELNARGWQSFYEPRATLIHHESKTRGKDSAKNNRARFAAELAALQRKWATNERCDPYHHPHLSRSSEQFVMAA